MRSPARILIVDDDDDIRNLIDMALSNAGYEVVCAQHGAEALSLLEHTPVDLILLDMRMPVMDGWEFARQYRARFDARAPVVVLTAARDAAERAAQVTADGFLPKPFGLDELRSAVAAYTGERKSA